MKKLTEANERRIKRIHKLRLTLKAYEVQALEDVAAEVEELKKHFDLEVVGPVRLPTKIRRYCVLSSPHVNKTARDHFEVRTHKRLIDFINPTTEAYKALLSIEIAAGVDVTIKRF